MKIAKKLLSCFLSAALLITGMSSAQGLVTKSLFSYDDLEYIDNGVWGYYLFDGTEGIYDYPCALLSCYIGEDSTVELPLEVDGYPIVKYDDTVFISASNVDEIIVSEKALEILEKSSGVFDASHWYTNTRKLIYSDSGLVYQIYKRTDKLTVKGYIGNDPDVVIPESFGGHTVYGISENAFRVWENYVPTPLPPEPDENGFVDPDAEPTYSAEDKLIMRSTAETVRNVSLPDSIMYVERGAFYDSTVETLNLPEGIRFIPDETFKNCSSLNLDIGDNITLISPTAFENTSVLPPEELIYRGEDSFDNSFSPLTENIDDWNVLYSFDYDNYGGLYAKLNKFVSDDSQISIPEYIRDIPVISVEPEFYLNEDGLSYAEELIIPPSITTLPDLSEWTTLKNVTFLGDTFEGGDFRNSQIEEITFPANYTGEASAFSGNKYIKYVSFAEGGNISLGDSAFMNCTNLDTFILPDAAGSLYIGNNAFMNCTDLDALVLPDTAESLYIGKNTFKNTGIGGDFVLPSYVKSIDAGAFSGCGFTSLTIQGNTRIRYDAFAECKDLKSVTINGSPDLDSYAFRGNDNLTNINADLSSYLEGGGFNKCLELQYINNESVLEEDDSIKPEFVDFVMKNFQNATDIGFINDYVKARVRETVSETVSEDMSDMEKLKALHDKVCEMTEYSEDASALSNHTDSSIFMNGKTVCEGYSRTLNLLLNEAGIESCYVKSFTHTWVIVKLGDHYFHVDPTWDDAETISYDWFLKTDDELSSANDGHHTDWEIYQPGVLHSFQTTELPVCDTLMGDVNSDGAVNAVDASEILTGYALASTGKESSTDEILGDFDFNGVVNAVDASLVLTYYAKQMTVH